MLEKINNKIIPFLDNIFVGKRKKYSLFFTAMIDSVIAILPTDLIVVYYFLRIKKASIFIQSFWIGLGSAIGGSLLYFFGSNILDFFPSILNSEYYLKIKEILDYSILIQFVLITFFAFSSTIPFTWLSIILGILNVNLSVYIIGVFLGRGLRFGLIAILSHKYGKKSLKLMRKYIWELFLIILFLALLYLIYKLWI